MKQVPLVNMEARDKFEVGATSPNTPKVQIIVIVILQTLKANHFGLQHCKERVMSTQGVCHFVELPYCVLEYEAKLLNK